MNRDFVITKIERIIMVGKEQYPQKFHSFSSHLASNELILFISGHSTVYFDDAVEKRLPDTVHFLPKGEVRKYDVMFEEPGECIDIFFQTDRPVSEKFFIQSVTHNERIKARFSQIFSLWMAKDEGYYFECLSLLYKIFADLQKSAYLPAGLSDRLKPAEQEILSRFWQAPLRLCELAALCGMSESYFKRLFKEKHGISPKQHIIQLKINLACELLRTQRYSITQVASLSGFSDVYFFSRQFKAQRGITPTQFVQKCKYSK